MPYLVTTESDRGIATRDVSTKTREVQSASTSANDGAHLLTRLNVEQSMSSGRSKASASMEATAEAKHELNDCNPVLIGFDVPASVGIRVQPYPENRKDGQSGVIIEVNALVRICNLSHELRSVSAR